MLWPEPGVEEMLGARLPAADTLIDARATARMLSRLSDESQSGYTHTVRAVKALELLSSAAVSAMIDRLRGDLARGMGRLADELFGASAAFDRFANECQSVQEEATYCVTVATEECKAISETAQRLREVAVRCGGDATAVPPVWHVPPPLVLPVPPGAIAQALHSGECAGLLAAGTWTIGATGWRRSLDAIETQRARWRQLHDRRAAAEQRLIADLQSTELWSIIAAVGVRRSAITYAYTGGAVHPSRRQVDAALLRLFQSRLTVAERAAAWRELDLSDEDLAGLPMPFLVALARMNGLDARRADVISRAVLEYARDHPRAAFRLMGLREEDLTVSAFHEHVLALHFQVLLAEQQAESLPNAPPIQLLNLGSHDGALTVAISIGDVARADRVAVNVSGMGSHVGDIHGALSGAHEVFEVATFSDRGITPAIVTWVGYRSPSNPPDVEVLGLDRADSGARSLASFLEGLIETRPRNDATPPFVVLAHSYGSTVAVQSLTMVREGEIDAFVAYGSAGFPAGIDRESVRAERVYSTEAQGDQVARVGRVLSGRVDPRDLPWVETFSSEEGEVGGRRVARVTMHGMYADPGEWSPVNWTKTGYLSPGAASAAHIGLIVAGAQ